MKYLPYDDFYITTALSPAEVEERLQKEIEPPKRFSFKDLFKQSSEYYFSGQAWLGRFKLVPVIQGRNSFVPHISGSIEPWQDGSRISVKMRLDPGVQVFMCIWIGSLLLGALAGLVAILAKGHSMVELLVPLGMSLFGYLITSLGFNSEAPDAKARLLKVLEGRIEE